MPEPLVEDFGKILIQHPEKIAWAKTSWGEEARVLVSPLHAGQGMCIMDYRAPSRFGPPRHVHFRDDEILRMMSGRVAVWSPTHCGVAGPGDVIVLPKGVPHTWRSLDEEVHMEVTTAPGDLEIFFERLEERRATITEIDVLNAISADVGVRNIGPRLSEEDAETILRGGIA